MTLRQYASADILAMEDKLQEVVKNLRQIRNSMEEQQMETTQLEASKAVLYMNYLAEWAISVEAKHRQNAARLSAQRLATKKSVPKKSGS